MHAELIGFEFIKMGYNLKVFAPTVESACKWWHHKIIRRKDEKFVTRCYVEVDPNLTSNGWLDEEKIVVEDLDYLIVESYASIPHNWIEKLVKKIKSKTVAVAVIHERFKREIGYSDLHSFNAVVVFDERYFREIVPSCKDIGKIIPYPCHPIKKGKRKFAEDVLTFFSFGRQPVAEYKDYIEVLENLSRSYDFIYKVIRSDDLLPFEKPWLFQKKDKLNTEQIYKLLHSSDIHLLPKGKIKGVVVSSTLFQCLGSLVPVVAPNTRHFESLPEEKPLVIYNNTSDLKLKLISLIEDEWYRNKVINLAKRYVEKNRSDKIAKKFIELFEELTNSA